MYSTSGGSPGDVDAQPDATRTWMTTTRSGKFGLMQTDDNAATAVVFGFLGLKSIFTPVVDSNMAFLTNSDDSRRLITLGFVI